MQDHTMKRWQRKSATTDKNVPSYINTLQEPKNLSNTGPFIQNIDKWFWSAVGKCSDRVHSKTWGNWNTGKDTLNNYHRHRENTKVWWNNLIHQNRYKWWILENDMSDRSRLELCICTARGVQRRKKTGGANLTEDGVDTTSHIFMYRYKNRNWRCRT